MDVAVMDGWQSSMGQSRAGFWECFFLFGRGFLVYAVHT